MPVNAIAQFIPGCGLYKIDYAARFRGAQYLRRPFPVAGNRKTWTLSFGMRRAGLSTQQTVFCGPAFAAGTTGFSLSLNPTDQFQVTVDDGVNSWVGTTAARFRDGAADYHVQLSVDTPRASGGSRVVLSVNGEQYTLFTTAGAVVAQNADLSVNAAADHTFGRRMWQGDQYFQGTLSDIVFVDGAALSPTAFGYRSNGVWVPSGYSGGDGYGTTGFRLRFDLAAALGADTSGNGNTWVAEGLTSLDQLTDTPTSVCPALNEDYPGRHTTLGDGDLRFSGSGAVMVTPGTISIPRAGAWVAEVTVAATGDGFSCGVVDLSGSPSGSGALTACVDYAYTGTKSVFGTPSAFGSAYAAGDVIGILVNRTAGTVSFYKNGTLQGTITSSRLTSAAALAFVVLNRSTSAGVTSSGSINFGQLPFAYPLAYGAVKPITTANIPIPTNKAVLDPYKYFGAATYTGTGGAQSVTLGFQPDLLWIKSRSGATDHWLMDTVRGVGNGLSSSTTSVESPDATAVTAVTSTGFTLGAANTNAVNVSGDTYVVWGWKAGAAAVANTAGTIAAQVSANPEAGISVATYTGTGVAGTVGHGLGTAPGMVLVFDRDYPDNRPVWHAGLPNVNDYLWLNSAGGPNQSGATSGYWSGSAPTALTISLGGGVPNFAGKRMVAYCFAEVDGLSRIGSFVGNGSYVGPYVHCGFRPRALLIKCVGGGGWYMFDAARDFYNPCSKDLVANSAAVEGSMMASQFPVDILSNGFKLRTINAELNAAGSTYIFYAIAEQPLVGQCNVPANAR